MVSPLVPAWIMGLASVAVLIPGLSLISPGFKKATLIFLVLGTSLLVATRQPFAEWITAVNSMTNTVAIIVVMQCVAIPVSMGRYDELICRWADVRVRTNKALFAFSTFVTHLLASFLNMGAIPLSINLMGRTIRSRMPQQYADQFIAVTVSRGYVLAALWAPPAINLYLVVQATGVPWSTLLLPGIILAILGFYLTYLLETRKGGALSSEGKRSKPIVADNCSKQMRESDNEFSGKSYRWISQLDIALIHVVIIAVSIVGIVFIMEKAGIGQGYTRIMVAGIIVTAVWSISIYDKKKFLTAVEEYWDDGILKVRDMGPFFVAMGLFSRSLESSGILDMVSPLIRSAANWLGLFSVAVLPFIMILLSIIGLHPFITIVMFGKILSSTTMQLPALSIAISLAVGGAAAYMISPFAGIIMSIARYTGARASQISVQWNGKYSLLFFVVGVLFAILWGMLVAV